MAINSNRADLRPMEQITKQGLSGDYYNALLCALMRYRDFRGGVAGAIEDIKRNPIERYTERFPPTHYAGVITSVNRASVSRLDAIADELNCRAADGSLTDPLYRALHLEACRILFGKNRTEQFGHSWSSESNVDEAWTSMAS